MLRRSYNTPQLPRRVSPPQGGRRNKFKSVFSGGVYAVGKNTLREAKNPHLRSPKDFSNEVLFLYTKPRHIREPAHHVRQSGVKAHVHLTALGRAVKAQPAQSEFTFAKGQTDAPY